MWSSPRCCKGDCSWDCTSPLASCDADAPHSCIDMVQCAVSRRLVKPWCPEIRSGCVLPRRRNTTRENAPIAGKGHGAIFSRDCLSNPPEWNEVEATSSIHDETPQSSHLSLQKALPPQVSKEPTNKMAVALLFCGDANAMFSHGTWTGYADHVVRPLREDANDVHSFVWCVLGQSFVPIIP